MLSKRSLIAVLGFSILLIPVAAAAQVAQVTGKVTLKQSDGRMTPVAGALVDLYRTDIRWEAHSKTDRSGGYIFAGVPFIGKYTIAVSAAGARPDYVRDVRVTQSPTFDFQLERGDGTTLTLDQIKAAGTSTTTTKAAPAERPDSQAAVAELERKNREIEESNRKIEAENATVARAFKAGNDAFAAKNYAAAIAAYDEGLAAREEPAIYANKSIALRLRGADRFNSAVRSQDAAVKNSGVEAAKKDWLAAAEAGKRALDIMKATAFPADPAEKSRFAENKLAAIASYAEAMRLVGTKVDPTRAEAAFQIYSEYAVMETDLTKRSQRKTEAAKILLDAGQFDRAAEEFRKILRVEPGDLDANLYLGLSLFNTGDKTKFQEAADHLGKFAEKAPASEPLKADALSILEFLKTQENITPHTPPSSRAKP